MNRVDNLSDNASQITRLILDDGSVVVLSLQYSAASERWTYSVSYGDFTFNGGNLCLNPNFMRQWRQVLPFGLACASTDGVDPFDVEDFASGRVSLYKLNAQDVQTVEQVAFGALS